MNINITHDPIIAKSYPLVPMQHGMLFNTLYHPDHGIDLTHIVYDLPEEIEPDTLHLAWQNSVEQHDIFRTSFQWQGVESPIQHVHQSAKLPFSYFEWDSLDTAVQEEKFKAFLLQDRQQGFDFTLPPLMRCALFKLGEQAFRFVWTFHHSIIDGRASSLVLYEAFTCYAALMNGDEIQSSESIPYQKYVDWLYNQNWDEAELFWRDQLAGFEQTTTIPNDLIGEPDVQIGGHAFEQRLFLTTETTSKLHAITQQYNITFNTLVQGAWGLLLHHYNNNNDIIFGAVRACRRSAFSGTENIIGQLLNTVPIRVKISPNTSTVNWLEALREQWNSIRPHEHAPYIKIKTWSDVPTGTPLFETIAVYDHATVETRLKALGDKWANRDIEIFFKTDSPISLYAHGGEHLLLSIYYDRTLYQDASVTRLLQQLENIFEAFATNIQQPISQINILSDDERNTVITKWNETDADFDDVICIHEMIAKCAKITPDLIAIKDGNTQLTYAQLEQQANQLAHYLNDQGVTTGTPVGICLNRSAKMIVAMVAILKSGGLYVPLDPGLPPERLNFIQTDAQLLLTITQGPINGLTCELLIYGNDMQRPFFQHMPATPPNHHTDAQQPAYMIYTSGSTGKPKGVLCHHRGVINLLEDFDKQAPIAERANHSLWTNITFDVSVFEIFSPLTTGGTLHIVPQAIRAKSSELLHWLDENNIQSAYLPPFMLADMAQWVEKTAHQLTLERLLVGVEPILQTTLAQINNFLPQTKIMNGYGPTEATIFVCVHQFSAENVQAKPTPIGRPTQNTQIYLLNSYLQPVPIGVAGELYIGGVGLAHGYWQRPDLTKNAFIPNPFIPGQRIYKTGDLARYLPNGDIEFLGRVDFQVKVRGYRVELGEIESTLHQHDTVKQVVVNTGKDVLNNNYLIAYIVPEKDTLLNETSLRNFLLKKLPDYMVPSTFIELDALPRTPNDKVDRKALPLPTQLASENCIAPQTPIEALIANTFTAVLGVEKVGRHSSFLQLGGHSLLATQVISRLNHALDIELPLPTLFTHPKVCDLAQAIQNIQAADRNTLPFTFIRPEPKQQIPLSYAQQQLWILQQLEPDNTAYNMPLALKLDGKLDTAVLERSLNEIVKRHDSLRTIFPETTEQPYQVVLPYTPFALPIVDLSTDVAPETAVQMHLRSEAQTPFNLTQSTLRISLSRQSNTEHILLFNTHHIISDGWSQTIITRELSALYQAYSNDQPASLSPLPYQYSDFAHSQRQWLQGETLTTLLNYWRKKLETAPTKSELPTDFTRKTEQPHSGKQIVYQLDEELSHAIRKLCQQEEVTLFMGMLAVFKTMLFRLTHQEDIVVGAPIANRTQLEIEQLIGFFMNTLVLRTELHGATSFNDLLKAVRKTTLEAYTHRDLPFEQLVEHLHPDRTSGSSPFFQLFFNMINVPLPASKLGDVVMTQLPNVEASAKFDLTLYVSETAVNINLELLYNSELFAANRMNILLKQYVSLLTQVTQNPDMPLTTYSLKTPIATLPDPTQSLRQAWQIPAHIRLTELADSQPHKIAVKDIEQTITYAQLEKSSNQLAHYLHSNNIGKGSVVAIYAARCTDLLLTVLAIHKAGAAFVILDPAYPSQRLHTYLEQAQPQAWLQLAAAGDVPQELTDYLNQHNVRCQLTLPTTQMGHLSTHPPAITTSPDDLAYIAFTSGTTGKPRAITGTHRPLAHFWAWQNETFTFSTEDQFTLFSGLAHDPLLRDLFAPIYAGGTLHIPTTDILFSAENLAQWMQDNAITITHLTPALGQILAAGATSIPTLRHAFFGGESLSKSIVDHIRQIAPNCKCTNVYGTTETPQVMGFYDIDQGLPKTIAPLGQGIDGVQLLILTSDLQLAGVGELGQIAVRTPYLADGYFGDAILTQKRFIPNPFIANAPDYDRIYLTGDYGRFQANGNVDYAGRSDGQINLRGFRIELSEIETALIQHPDIQQAVVRLPQTEQLIAYIVTKTNPPADEDLQLFLKEILPSYMIPSLFVALEQLPVTPNGKLDIKALPIPESTTAFIVPSTATEAILHAIWVDVLQQGPLSVTANFFALGGHSLLGTQIMSRIRQQMGVDLPLQAIFNTPTIAGLAQAVAVTNKTTQPIFASQAPQDNYPLSFAQQRLWFLHQLENDNSGYTIGVTVALRGSLNFNALEQSLNAIVARHETLRTTFIMVNEQPRQIVHSAEHFTIPVQDVAESTNISTLIDTTLCQPFDLATGPLVQFRLLRIASEHHIIIINLHHIIADGWSGTLLINELGKAYHAYATTGQWSPAPLPMQYPDYAQWQRNWLMGDVLEKQLAYWEEQLKGDLPIIDLPSDAPRPAKQTFAGQKLSVSLSAKTRNALRLLSQTHNASLFMTLLAGFKLLLHRLTQQNDIIVGTPIANRNQQETEALIGFFANTLLLRTQLASDETFTDLLHAIRKTTLDAYAHQDLPFERLVEALQPARDLSRPPLFQLFFNMINVADYGKFDLPGLQTELIENGRIISKFDLTLYILDDGQEIRFEAVYNRDLYHEDRMSTLLAQYVTILTQVVDEPNQLLSAFSLTTSSTKLPDPTRPLLAQWHTPAHVRLSEWAQQQPHKIAIIDPQSQWTYADLEAQANQLAHYLLAQGIQKDDVVAIVAQRSASLVIAMFAIHKAGAAFTLLDPAYPAARQISYLKQAQPAAWLQIQPNMTPEIDDYWAQQSFKFRVRLSDIPLAQYPTTTPNIETAPSDLAYIAFTSGTSGEPRAICGTHLPLAHFWQWHTQTFALSSDDCFTLLSGLAHDPLLRDVFTPFTIGATLYIPDSAEMISPNYLANWMAQQNITATHITPALSQLMTTTATQIPTLRWAFLGGESLTAPVVNGIQATAPNAVCVNFYGTTETPQAMAYHPIEFENSTAVFPLGHGIEGVQLLVLTSDIKLAGIGELGQIVVRSPYLSTGYANNLDLTQTKFIPNPFISTPDANDRLYLTGDYGRFLPNGDVEFVGRNDRQINLRGYRIELSEIETAVAKHPTVQQSIVKLHDQNLIAYIVTDTAVAAIDPATLRTYLQQHLPSYMIPNAIIPLTQLPLTPNGKVNHHTLPDPAPYLIANTHNYVAPRTPTEIELVNIWADLLHQDHIGMSDDFFALGGHSLLATQLISRIQTMFAVPVSLTSFFADPTILRLAELIETAQHDTSAPPLRAQKSMTAQPLSFAQQRLWFLDQLDDAAINIPFALHLRGQVDIGLLSESINHIVERHTTLRTTFSMDGDYPVQQIRPFSPIQLHHIDLTTRPEHARLEEARTIATQESLHKFNLQTDCLLRPHLIHLGNDEFILLITIHHIAADGWSAGILFNELTVIYSALKEKRPFPLAPLPVQYIDYAVWQRNWLQGDVLEKQLTYWRQQLADAPAGLALPTDHAHTATTSFASTLHRFTVRPEVTRQLKSLSQKERSTLFMTLLTAFEILLYRYTGQNDIVIGTPIANRNQQAIENLIGFFVNTLVLRTQVDPDLTVTELLAQVREMALAAYTHQDVPFEKLVEELKPERDLTRTPFFQVMFILQNAPSNDLAFPDITAETFALTQRVAQHDLTTLMWEEDNTLHGIIEYKTELFAAETIAQFCTHFERILAAIATHPKQKIGDLSLLSEAEIKQLRMQQRGKSHPIKPLAVHQLFEETARITPEKVALETAVSNLTYAQLNQQANQLAHYLQTEGIQKGNIIGIMLPRSADALVAILATLKIGATYLILDTTYPADRLQTIIADAQPVALLCHSEMAKQWQNRLLTISVDQLTLTSFPKTNLNHPYAAQDPAYIIYTSGSTGTPKGVLIPHRALSNHCQAIASHFALEATDRVLQFASLSFDVAAEEIFPTWATGATLVLRPDELPLSFNQYVTDQQLTVLNLPAAYWHDWVAHNHQEQLPIPNCVRLMVVGSEKVLPLRLKQWQEIAPTHIRWFNAYGPTEATITATIYEHPATREIVEEDTAVSIGQPIANITTHILDKQQNLVPNGVLGELYIGGAGIALGYLNRPELTANAFIINPHTQQRLYKTGDLARRLPCGNIAFWGRADNQVKVRGFRIELGDIEAALHQYSTMQDCLVIAQESPNQPTQLIAYCVTSDTDMTSATLRQFLQTQLPNYMIPSTFILLDQFTYTTNGKINRQALPSPDNAAIIAYTPPTTENEKLIAAIWADVLNQSQVGLHDNFFDLGGHSLIATQIVSRIRQALTIELPIRTLFERPTISELVSTLPSIDLFDESEEALLADLLDEFEDFDFDELEEMM